jgi:hypothetical protein
MSWISFKPKEGLEDMATKEYKNRVSLVVRDCIDNYLTYNNKPEEAQFIQWLSERKFYYCNRFTNTICNHPAHDRVTELDIINLVCHAVDKLQAAQVHLEMEEQELMKGAVKGNDTIH